MGMSIPFSGSRSFDLDSYSPEEVESYEKELSSQYVFVSVRFE
jgi:hypothetical protein